MARKKKDNNALPLLEGKPDEYTPTTKTKVQQQNEIYKNIWSFANGLRGAVDGWEFKQYVLGFMFYRYISENFCNYVNKEQKRAGKTDFNYALLQDDIALKAKTTLTNRKGFFIIPSELFENVCKNADKNNSLNVNLQNVFKNIENSSQGTESEDDFKGLFQDIDVTSPKLGNTEVERNKRLKAILNGIAEMELGAYDEVDVDPFGDAYEFLMGMYASSAGKSGGEFYTPAEVSELLTKLATVGKTSVRCVYDPACGSGSLLLKAKKVLGVKNVTEGFFGQEINISTYNLCRINMFLHDIPFDKFDIRCADTLTNPQHNDDQPFEVIVSNPPYSLNWEGETNSILINDPRYSPAGVLAPTSKADLAFVMHSLAWLSSDGVAAIVCFPGILYRGGKEAKIRQYLIDNNFIDAVIQLPQNLFFGTSIATSILIMKKNRNIKDVLFIDASNEFIKEGNSNRLTNDNITHILDQFSKYEDVQYKVKKVSDEDIANNEYNLSVSTYVEQEDTREKIDIKKLNAEIEEIVKKEQEYRLNISKFINEFKED